MAKMKPSSGHILPGLHQIPGWNVVENRGLAGRVQKCIAQIQDLLAHVAFFVAHLAYDATPL